jgi:indole-3-glycerol phosphate synthase
VARERRAWAESLPPVAPPEGPLPPPFAAIFEGVAGAVIAEVKPVSPAAGELLGGRDPLAIAASFAGAGAKALSVLTEAGSFGGSFDLLDRIVRETSCPVLAKDVVVHEVQMRLARNAGASAVLLIADLLAEAELTRLAALARSLGMEPVVEVHDQRFVPRVEAAQPRVVAVNARDLRTLAMERESHVRLIDSLPGGVIPVAASGIESPEEICALAALGYRGFLIGTALMCAPDPEGLLRGLVAAAEGR